MLRSPLFYGTESIVGVRAFSLVSEVEAGLQTHGKPSGSSRCESLLLPFLTWLTSFTPSPGVGFVLQVIDMAFGALLMQRLRM